MGTRFTRVTVVGDGRQIDISLPADTPLAEQMPTVLRLLSVPITAVPVRWRLAAPEFGPIDPSRSLDEVGVLDGSQLYLTEAAAAPPPPFVDDVETTVAEMVRDSAANWSGEPRRSAVARLLAVMLTATVVFGLYAPSPIGWAAPAVVVVAALAVGRVITGRGGWFAVCAAVPAAATLLLGFVAVRPSAFGLRGHGAGVPGAAGGVVDVPLRPIDELSEALRWNGFPLALIAAAAIGLVLAGLVRRTPGVVLAGAATAAAAVAAIFCLRLGLPPDRTAGLGLLVGVSLAGLAGQAALGGAGLVDLMVADERGEPVPREAVATAVRRGLGTAGGMLWAAVGIGAVACSVLILRTPVVGTAATWTAPALGALGGLIFALRSRMFTRTRHVGPMLLVAVVVMVALALRAPSWLSADPAGSAMITLSVLVVAGALTGVAGLRTLREVAGARWQRNLERLELVAMLALVPGLVLLFRVIQTVQRWWG